MLLFVALLLTIFGGAHYYLYTRLLAALDPCSARELWALRALMVSGAVSFPLLRILSRAKLWRAPALVHWVVGLWLGFALYALLAALVLQAGALVLRIAGLDLPRSMLLGLSPGHTGLVLVIAAAVVLAGFGFASAQSLPRTTEVELTLAHLPASLDRFSVVQLSDVHVGAFSRPGRLRRMVEQVNALAPDLVVITGDLADEKHAHVAAATPVLQLLKAPHGVLAVMGNHDFFAGVDEVAECASRAGIRWLRNERITVADAIDVYGIDDPMSARVARTAAPRFEQVIGSDPHERPSILLYHQPLGFARLAEMGLGLVLSGHTHGGQLWPIGWLSRRVYPHNAGHYRIGASHFYVSRGTGTWGPPMRLGASPEIVHLRLRTPLPSS